MDPQSFGAQFVLSLHAGELGLWFAAGLFWLRLEILTIGLCVAAFGSYIFLITQFIKIGVNYLQKF